MTRACYFAAEVATLLGMNCDNLYRKGVLEKLYAAGMPRSVTQRRLRIPKAAFDAWLTRDHPLQPKPPANDVTAPLTPSSNADWQAFLQTSYARVSAHKPR